MDRQTASAEAVTGSSRGRVLVVEDEAHLLRLFVRALEYNGYECDSATSGDQALWSVLGQCPDVIVLDVVIPHPSGIEVCRHLRSRGWNGGVVVVSARANPQDRDAALRAGADMFLAKPFALSELVAAIDSLLSNTGAPAAKPPGPAEHWALRAARNEVPRRERPAAS